MNTLEAELIERYGDHFLVLLDLFKTEMKETNNMNQEKKVIVINAPPTLNENVYLLALFSAYISKFFYVNSFNFAKNVLTLELDYNRHLLEILKNMPGNCVTDN